MVGSPVYTPRENARFFYRWHHSVLDEVPVLHRRDGPRRRACTLLDEVPVLHRRDGPRRRACTLHQLITQQDSTPNGDVTVQYLALSQRT